MTDWVQTDADGGPCRFEDVIVFYRVKERWGGLSNMSNAFPLLVGGLRVKSSEALYQACRFPERPDWQREILDAPHAMAAKMKAKKEGRRAHHSREDWPQIQVAVMRWVLGVKLAQHGGTFGELLRDSANQAIVEQSRSDDFWGAKVDPANPGLLRGRNVLGCLLVELRTECLGSTPQIAKPHGVPGLLLLGQQVGDDILTCDDHERVPFDS